MVAWGLRNPFGLAFAPDGRLYVTDNGYDERGSRPVFGSADFLWAIDPGRWYGWPDYAGGVAVASAEFRGPGADVPRAVLAKAPNPPPQPAANFPVHASATGLDFSRSDRFGHVGQAFVALFGDMAPGVGKVQHPVGFKVVRVNLAERYVEDFARNRRTTGAPASWAGSSGLERPVAVRFDPDGVGLFVVDFGVLAMEGRRPRPVRGTGVVWRIVRSDMP
jgi:glucose/arabinose dehydrogenase